MFSIHYEHIIELVTKIEVGLIRILSYIRRKTELLYESDPRVS
jgi:hypothetical protein